MNYQDDGESIAIREWLDDKVEEMRQVECPGCVAKAQLERRMAKYKAEKLTECVLRKQLHLPLSF